MHPFDLSQSQGKSFKVYKQWKHESEAISQLHKPIIFETRDSSYANLHETNQPIALGKGNRACIQHPISNHF